MEATSAILWLIGIPLLSSPIIYILGRLYVRNPKNDPSKNPYSWLALFFLALTCVPYYYLAKSFITDKQLVQINFGMINLSFDGIAFLLSGVALALGLMVVIYSKAYMSGEAGEEKFFALLNIMIGAIIGLGCAFDLFNLWVWFELMAISSYVLVAFYKDEPAALEAGVKYLVQSATGSVFVVLGISLVFLETGTLSLSNISVYTIPGDPLLIVAGAFFFIGFGVKAAIFPLHTWLPDAHSQAPSGISAMLSGIVIETGLIALLRAIGALNLVTISWGPLLIGVGAINMLLGNLMALRQKEVKRLLAFSSLTHMGYILFGFGVAILFQNMDSAQGSFFHIITHSLMKGLAFLSAGALMYALHYANGKHSPLVLDDLNGSSKKYPLLAFMFSLAVLSLGSLPPMAGFMSKWQILVGSFETKDAWVIAGAIFVALNGVLSLAYYAPMVNRIYRGVPGESLANGKPVSVWMTIPMAIMTLAIVAIGVMPGMMNWITSPAAAYFIAGLGR